ncbi:MAG: hypothetical protein ROZ00_05120 [Denitratisoma sp.]|nr:hypothetical protein [Denitratisoma sp.]
MSDSFTFIFVSSFLIDMPTLGLTMLRATETWQRAACGADILARQGMAEAAEGNCTFRIIEA